MIQRDLLGEWSRITKIRDLYFDNGMARIDLVPPRSHRLLRDTLTEQTNNVSRAKSKGRLIRFARQTQLCLVLHLQVTKIGLILYAAGTQQI